MQTLNAFLEYFDKVRARTVRVAKCIPPEHIEWTCQPGKFTLGDLLRHLAGIERYMFVENACKRESRYAGHGRELAQGHQAVLDYLERMHSESMAILRTLSDNDLQSKCKNPDGSEITVWKWLRAMIEHEIHHRGQIYLYLSILGVKTPPLFGLTEEEVRARSKSPGS